MTIAIHKLKKNTVNISVNNFYRISRELYKMSGFSKVKSYFPKIYESFKTTFVQYLRVSSITGLKYTGHRTLGVRYPFLIDLISIKYFGRDESENDFSKFCLLCCFSLVLFFVYRKKAIFSCSLLIFKTSIKLFMS